ncbi:uncharacterized protein PV09_05633 [Verruconis gallopava]|uniref:Cupin type-1 domain-containing protein n=1 Tax=Verruconis gallopava TaxID=253628 RepID=A0A0D1YQY4_9PEZI|nr:uncharacterized protein PV09_05633 [Verruconis gallopava]KIW02972.1 hypothetical protein PV09_05633 [Verruconis gallopava]
MFVLRYILPVAAYCAASLVEFDDDLAIALKTAPVDLDKFLLLKDAKQPWTFDFRAQANYTFSPGSVKAANAYTSPLMYGTGMTMQLISLGPCGILPPHEHPRADNIAIAIHGTTQTWMYNENGAELISTILTPGVMTVFPKGSVHSMMNMGCSNAQLVSVLNNEDPGTLNILNAATHFPDGLIGSLFQGGLSKQVWNRLEQTLQPVGTGSQWGTEACYKACGVPYKHNEDNFTFDDSANIWDGGNGTRSGYYDAGTGKQKLDNAVPYYDDDDDDDDVAPRQA